MRLEPREHTPLAARLLAPVAAVAAALALCALLVAWTGAPVLRAYGLLLEGAAGSRFALTETLTRATPLILTGLAAAVAFRAKLWNIGAEGQLYMGALAAVVLGGGVLDLPAWLLLPTVMIAGAAAGGATLLGPAVLKVRFGVDEVVTTLLLNFIVLLLVSMLLEGALKDPMGMGWPQSAPVVEAAELPKLVERTRLHTGLLVALGLSALLWLIDTRTIWGYENRAVGANPRAAAFAGMPVTRVMLRTALLSGGLAGLAGVIEVCGLKGYLTLDLSPGFGYSGIVVAMLAQLHPVGVVGAAVFIAGIFVGADAMSRAMPVPNYIADVLVATSLLCMLVAGLLTRYRLRRG
ncbi:ABC transporter permease [Azospirillum brasilense]|uniref:ABC transporter permease n=1 Tax=Azospirillum brasilense TaxID=192 RepID=UPI000E68F174|nr:ABC transporter permease [Azospirillum brasilense]NUB26316.1 ABC transporter permease [Azospirillum brasilense]NUB33915.1 ABC transporter permease [Azospirillum brasilense]RIV98700.1 ABC transporter permease [Azospirillum brasilense]